MRGGAGGAGGGLGYDGVGSGATYRTNRGLLFGSREGGGSTGGGASGNPNVSAARDAEAVERDNQMQVDSLTGKVGMMKDLAIQIGDEVNSQNRMLNDMGTQFENAGDLIGTTMRRLNEMIGSDASSKQILYLVAFMVFMVILVYFLFHGNN